MSNEKKHSSSLLLVLVLIIGGSLYLYRLTTNPQGFFIDESSVAYNAHTISQTGRDEYGNEWPLFFPAFGEYKNPVYIYLLAAMFKVTGPGIFVARLLSAASVLAAIVLLGLLAARVTEDKRLRTLLGSLVALSALLTPWFFELSRVSIEVALFPFTVVLFLVLLHRATQRITWLWSDSIYLGLALALTTYTYSVGRLLGPLLALGVVIFATRLHWSGIIRFWAIYLLTLVPLISYQRLHDSALTARFGVLTYVSAETPVSNIVRQFFRHYFANLDPRRLIWHGDPNIYQVIHVYGQPAMLVATLVLVLLGVGLVMVHKRQDRWWWFVGYGTLVSVIPASLTTDDFHMLRLSALSVFLLLFSAPAMSWLWQRRVIGKLLLSSLILFTLVQGFMFQRRYHESAEDPWRRHLFDADYKTKIFDAALATGKTPIYLTDVVPGPYIQAYWYATLMKIPTSTFIRLAPRQLPPSGSLVITTEEKCPPSQYIARVEPYTLFLAGDEPQQPAQLTSFKASLEVAQSSLTAEAGKIVEIPVTVRNVSNVQWPGCQRGTVLNQIFVGSHWLDSNGEWAKEEGRAPLPTTVSPGESANVKFSVTAPLDPGTYVLELDLLQEGVAWFSRKGSTPLRINIRVND